MDAMETSSERDVYHSETRSSKLGPAIQLGDSRVHKTTYAPMIYTALCVMFLMRADSLCGEVGGGGGGGWRWKSRVLWAPEKLHEPIGECNLGPKNHRCINSYFGFNAIMTFSRSKL
jgi:hypothetical protein